jgi:phage portal protein BeeE
MTAMGFRETLTSHCVLQGNAYAQIIRRSGTGVAIEMQPLMPNHVRAARDKQKRLVYVVKVGNDQEKTYPVERNKPQDIFHMRGITRLFCRPCPGSGGIGRPLQICESGVSHQAFRAAHAGPQCRR